MAREKKEGYTPLPNAIYEALEVSDLNSLQLRAVMYLWRTTHGWRQNRQRLEYRDISFPEWTEKLNAQKGHVSTALKELESRNIIKREYHGKGRGYSKYQLNTDTETWMAVTKYVTVSVTKDVTVGVTKNDPNCYKKQPEVLHAQYEQHTHIKKDINKNINKSNSSSVHSLSLEDNSLPSEHEVNNVPTPNGIETFTASNQDTYTVSGDDAGITKLLKVNTEAQSPADIEAPVDTAEQVDAQAQPLADSGENIERAADLPEWPGDFRKMVGTALDRAKKAIFFILDNGEAPGQPDLLYGIKSLKDMKLMFLNYDEMPDDWYDAIRYWFNEARTAKVSKRD